MAFWYLRFVQDFSTIVAPLTQLTKKGEHWRWSTENQQAFETLKEKLTHSPILSCPDFSREFTLQTDASDVGLGAVFTQETEEGEKVISYASQRQKEIIVRRRKNA